MKAASQGAKRSFLINAAIYGLGGIALQAAAIVLLPLYTRYLTPADFGVLELLNRTGDFLGVVLMANGLSAAAYTFYCQAEDVRERGQIGATLILLVWGAVCAGIVVAALASPLLDQSVGIDSPRLLTFGLVASLLQLTTAVLLALAQAREEAGFYVAASFLMLLLRVGLIIAAVVLCGWGIWGIVGATAASALISSVVLTCREFLKGGIRPDFLKLPAILRFALPFVPGGLCGFVLYAGDRFFLVRYSGQEEVGVYALGYKLAGVVGMLAFAPFFKVWSAVMYQVFPKPDGPKAVGRNFTRMLGLYAFVGLGVCLLRNEVLWVFGSAAYADAASVIGPLVLALYFMNAAVLMDGAFYVYRCSGRKMFITMSSTAVILVLYATLIPNYGAIGAALAALGAFTVHAGITYFVSQRVFRTQYEPVRVVGMLALAMALYTIGAWAPIPSIAAIERILLWFAWPVLAWTLGLIDSEEKARVLHLLRRAVPWSTRVSAPVRDTGDS